jgi:hypothetical protein
MESVSLPAMSRKITPGIDNNARYLICVEKIVVALYLREGSLGSSTDSAIYPL